MDRAGKTGLFFIRLGNMAAACSGSCRADSQLYCFNSSDSAVHGRGNKFRRCTVRSLQRCRCGTCCLIPFQQELETEFIYTRAAVWFFGMCGHGSPVDFNFHVNRQLQYVCCIKSDTFQFTFLKKILSVLIQRYTAVFMPLLFCRPV